MDHHGDGVSLLTKLGVGALTCNSVFAAYRSRGDPGTLAFVLAAYAALLLLLHSLRRFERAPPADRGRAKAEVWALSTLLTVMFASRVAPLMPPTVGVAVWAMAAATAGGGFWAFFLSHR
ncbi:hypothetical protein SEVIR_4G033400v4 [Setaria viridis]|uniref:Uncharacterized protein n=2 Tax=Setaria TaxID=4554 RepID=K3Y027_SETIT|nr:uncharacterized protein LOC101768522 [Setaria italica]XP_034592285.1 uncharacterized protein LOC117854102 [Setaria viridis]RCV20169.1 hypothetical protein SETIT_4G034600v2 [Setaria italica]TKW19632.1 hypothetical protein SEVIR_4G033400v2 [Setaria viridis]